MNDGYHFSWGIFETSTVFFKISLHMKIYENFLIFGIDQNENCLNAIEIILDFIMFFFLFKNEEEFFSFQ